MADIAGLAFAGLIGGKVFLVVLAATCAWRGTRSRAR